MATSDRIMADYYELRYTPDRCFWVVVGDAEPERTFELIEAEMNGWGRRHLAEPSIPPEPAQCAPRADSFVFADPLERLAVGIRIPEITHPDIAAYDVLSGILGMTLLVWLVNAAHNIITSPADEPGYYSNLVHFLAGDFSERWHFTVGTSIFYLPFELLSGTRQLSDIMMLLSCIPRLNHL